METEAPPPLLNYRSLDPRTRWTLVAAATLTMTVSYFDRQVLAVLAPVVTQELHLSEAAYGFLLSAFSFAYLVGAPFAGRLLDRIGARVGLVFAAASWSGIAAIHALVPTYGWLMAARIGLGLTEAPSFPGAAQVIHRVLPPSDRSKGFGILFTGSSIGAMLAPPVASYFLARAGFRVAFFASAMIGMLWLPLWIHLTRHHNVRDALDHAPNERSPHPTGTFSLWRTTATMRAVAVVLAVAPTVSFVLNWAPKFLVSQFSVSASGISKYVIGPTLMFDLGAVLFGFAASRRTRRSGTTDRPLFLIGVTLSLCGGLLANARSPWMVSLAASLALSGAGGLFALVTGDMLKRIPSHAVSKATGITAAAQSLAYIVASPLVGAAIDRTGGYSRAIIGMVLWILPGCLFWLLCPAPPVVEATD